VRKGFVGGDMKDANRYALEILELASSGKGEELARRINASGPDFGRAVARLEDEKYLKYAGMLSVKWEDGTTFVPARDITEKGIQRLEELKQKTGSARLRTWAGRLLYGGIGAILMAIIGLAVTDWYGWSFHRKEAVAIMVSWGKDGATVRLVGRGEPTVISSIKLLYYADKEELKSGKPSGEAFLSETGRPEVRGLNMYWNGIRHPMNLSDGEPYDASLDFKGDSVEVMDKLRKGLVFVEVWHTMSDEPVRKRLTIPEGKP